MRPGSFSLSLAARVMLGAAGIVAVCAVGLVYLIVDKGREAYVTERGAALTNQAQRSAARFVLGLDAVRRDVLLLAHLPPVQGIVRAARNQGMDPEKGVPLDFWSTRLPEIFSAFAGANPEYVEIRYIGVAANGRELIRVDAIEGRARVAPPETLRNAGGSDDFQATLKLRAGEVYLSEISLDRGLNNILVPHLRAATPVFRPEGDLFGMIVITVNIGPAIDLITTDLPPGVQAYLANGPGDYLAHPDSRRISGVDQGRRHTLQQDMPGLQVPSHPGSGRELLQTVSTPAGLVHLAVERVQFDPRAPERFLLLAYALPDTLIAAEVAGLRNATAAAVAGIALLLLGVVVLGVYWAFAPLTRLSALAEQIGAGRYDVALPTQGVGGLGSLIRAFRGMLDGISARERVLTVLRDGIDTMPTGFVIYDDQDRLFMCNQSYRNFYPESADILVPGVRFEDILREGLARGRFPAAAGHEEEWLCERLRWQRKPNGTIEERLGNGRWVLVTKSRVANGYVAGLRIDITERKQTEEARRESQNLLNRAQRLSHIGYIHIDLESGETDWSDETYRIFGVSRETFVPSMDNYQSLVHPDDRAPVHAIQEEARQGINPEPMEYRIVRPDGTVRHVSRESELMRDEAGRPQSLVSTIHDITERREAEQALRASEIRYRRLFETSLDLILITDSKGTFARVSPSAITLLGYGPDEMVGCSAMEFLYREDLDNTRNEMRKARRTGMPQNFECRYVHKEGRLVTFWWKGVWSDSDRRYFFVGRDITERTEAAQRIQGQLEHLHLLDHITRAAGERQDLKSIFQVVVGSLENSLPIDFGAVCLYDPASNALSVTCIGVKSAELAHALAMDENASIGIDDNGLGRCVRGHLVYEPDIGQVGFPFPERLAQGGLRSLVMAPLRSESRIFGVLVAARRAARGFSSVECEFLRQLSEHVALAAHQAQLYGALQQAYDELRQTQEAMLQEERLRALGQMASGIAHDINNALSPVSIYAESLLETEHELSERGRGYLETIQRAIEDVAQTVARLREFYRQRETQLDLAPVELNSMVQQVVELTRARWSDMPLQHGIVIQAVTELAPDLPKIMGVESEIREALTNLVLNAVDAMQQGGTLTLRTRLAEGDARRASVVVEVADSGIGMDEDTRRRCLEPFFTTKGERGTGLGLAMVFGMVQRHGADIEIDSTPGFGTTMRLVFAVPAVVAPGPGRQAPLAPPTRLRILLIDDDPILLKSLRDALEIDGHVIVTANSGREGIATLRDSLACGEPFAAVITDLGMPYLDGRRVAAAVKEATPETPVILLTGWGQRLAAEGDIPPHVDRILAKPPRLRDLREALAQVCPPHIA